MATRDPVRPYDPVFSALRSTEGLSHLAADDALRIFEANRFQKPVFYEGPSPILSRCEVTGPDGRIYDGAEVLRAIIMTERLERLCQDRSDAVVGLLNRKDPWSVWNGPK